MTTPEIWKAIQTNVGVTPDGDPGPKTAKAIADKLGIETGEPVVEVDGDDLVVRNIRCTCFGGANDPQDSGETASGVSTKDPSTRGVALPRRYIGPNKALQKALGDGIIPPKVPFHLLVEVTDRATGHTETAPFIDLGPATYTENYLDVTVAVAKTFNPNATATNFEMICSYRVLGGAKYA